MIYLRSMLFNVALYFVTTMAAVICLPSLILSRNLLRWVVRLYARTLLVLLKCTVGISFEVRGLDNLPPGPCIVASKHQSAWETIAYLVIWPDPVFFIKSELFRIPLYGWYLRSLGMMPVKRQKAVAAIRGLSALAEPNVAAGRQLIIFPEGTRKHPGDAPDYKPGVIALYERLRLPCVPVALNSGLYWPRRSFLKYPGKIIVNVLEPIPCGLPRAEFRKHLQDEIETATRTLFD
jgi:1-acyl-sn-glycerol-3-phosphate acyltransferase